MLLAKLFGLGRGPADADLLDDEPTHVGPVRDVPTMSHSQAVAEAQAAAARKSAAVQAKATGGFDPYNSGMFNRARAWERTTKR